MTLDGLQIEPRPHPSTTITRISIIHSRGQGRQLELIFFAGEFVDCAVLFRVFPSALFSTKMNSHLNSSSARSLSAGPEVDTERGFRRISSQEKSGENIETLKMWSMDYSCAGSLVHNGAIRGRITPPSHPPADQWTRALKERDLLATLKDILNVQDENDDGRLRRRRRRKRR